MSSTASTSGLKRLSPKSIGRIKKRELPFIIDQVWVDRRVADHPQTIRILNNLRGSEIDIVDDARELKAPRDMSVAKRQLILAQQMGSVIQPCRGTGEGLLCCNYLTIDLISGCPMDCSYCTLQAHLARKPFTTVCVEIEKNLAEVSSFLTRHSGRLFRIGMGDLSDSLALDGITGFASVLVPFFASKRNAFFEVKTKTAFIDELLDLKHNGHTVISWFVNTEAVITSEEHGTASLDERLAAAQKIAGAGYGIGFHFDPIILKQGADDIKDYLDVADKIFDAVEARQIAWVSLGLFRYPPELAAIAAKRFPQTKIFTGESVPTGSKMRYPRFIREAAYRPLWEKLRSKLPPHKIYLCMETPAVWERIDPSIETNSCLERRLCNMEAIPFAFRS